MLSFAVKQKKKTNVISAAITDGRNGIFIPDSSQASAGYAKISEQKEALCADYGKLKKQVKEYDAIKRNIDNFFLRLIEVNLRKRKR